MFVTDETKDLPDDEKEYNYNECRDYTREEVITKEDGSTETITKNYQLKFICDEHEVRIFQWDEWEGDNECVGNPNKNFFFNYDHCEYTTYRA